MSFIPAVEILVTSEALQKILSRYGDLIREYVKLNVVTKPKHLSKVDGSLIVCSTTNLIYRIEALQTVIAQVRELRNMNLYVMITNLSSNGPFIKFKVQIIRHYFPIATVSVKLAVGFGINYTIGLRINKKYYEYNLLSYALVNDIRTEYCKSHVAMLFKYAQHRQMKPFHRVPKEILNLIISLM